MAPFEAEMLLPQEAVGSYRLLAVAQVKERRGFYILFDETFFKVSPDASLLALRAESPVRFINTIGEVQLLNVGGFFVGRIVRDLTWGNACTVYRSSNHTTVREIG